ncbi:MAG: ABC transporter substrate-binding protein [Ginsengibacter sp.]
MKNSILKGITWDHPRGYDPLIACSLLYTELYGVTIEWEKRSLSNFGDESLAGLAARYDLLIIDHPHTGVAYETNCLFSLNELLKEEIIDALKKQTAGPCFSSYEYKGTQWALPIDAAMQCASYRKDLLDDIEPPKNWEEVFKFADTLKKKNLKIGMALCPTDSLCSFLSITAQLGSPVIEDKTLLLHQDIGLQSLELMRKMRDNFHENSLNWNPIQLYDHMCTHDDIAYVPLAFCYANYSRDGFRKNELSFTNAPGYNNAVLGGAGIGISSKSKFLQQAAHYAAWICSAEIQGSVYVTAQGQPANMVAWKSVHSNELTNNFFCNTFDTLANAFVRPRYSGWPGFQKYLGEVVHDHLKNNTDPLKMLGHLQEVYNLSYKKII